MKKLFLTPIDKLYSIATILVLIMIIFPPTCDHFDGALYFYGYEFIFNVKHHLIDTGRLLLQFILLGSIVITIKRIFDLENR